MDYKEITKKAFDEVADDYIKRDKQVVAESSVVLDALEKFSLMLSPGARVLDIGSGGGRDSRYFFKKGFDVIGIDISKEMIDRAKKIEPKINYQVMDFEVMNFSEASFDGIWANASLHHVPKKEIGKVLLSIARFLKSGGVCFIKVKQGDSEGLRKNEKFGKKIIRYFAYYHPEEIKVLIEAAGLIPFKIEKTTQDEWVDVFARK